MRKEEILLILFFPANEPCKLHCVADTPSYVFTIKHTATDGMTCGEDGDDICVDGTCRVKQLICTNI